MNKASKTTFAVIFLFFFSAGTAEDFTQKAFPNKLIFSETPELGKKWHGGIRMTDIFIWDMYVNVSNYAQLDFLKAGLPNVLKNSGGELTDNFSAFTIKSRPLAIPVANNFYKIGGGIKVYSAEFNLSDSVESLMSSNDGSLLLFTAESYSWNARHYCNLYSSLSFRSIKAPGGKNTITTYYLVPAYRFSLSKNWNIAFEYYMTNSMQLPMKILQIAGDTEGLEFYNPEQEMVSFMFWGFNYTREHFRLDLNLGNHISFQGPIVPMIGVGWNF